MQIRALAPWYGSKRTLAPRVIELLGPHRVYWEPFCGSMAVLLAKPPVAYESVNDLHADLINLALVLQDERTGQELYGRAARTLFHEDLLKVAKARLMEREIDPAIPDVERAYWYLVFSWMSLNGVSGTPLNHTGTFAVRYSAKGGNGATRWRSTVASIPWWHERLIGVQILHRDGFTLLEAIDDADGTSIYVDPPYVTKGAKYVHDFCATDHQRLADLLGRFRKARVVVSYYDHPSLKPLYSAPKWTWVRCSVAKSMVNYGRRDSGGRVDAPEVLIVNHAVSVSQGGLFDE